MGCLLLFLPEWISTERQRPFPVSWCVCALTASGVRPCLCVSVCVYRTGTWNKKQGHIEENVDFTPLHTNLPLFTHTHTHPQTTLTDLHILCECRWGTGSCVIGGMYTWEIVSFLYHLETRIRLLASGSHTVKTLAHTNKHAGLCVIPMPSAPISVSV